MEIYLFVHERTLVYRDLSNPNSFTGTIWQKLFHVNNNNNNNKFVQNELIYNSFQANAPILHTLKMSENQSFVDTFRGQKTRALLILSGGRGSPS